MIKRSRSVKSAGNPYLTDASVNELNPANRIAYDIVTDRRDLLPSVERIMNAGLTADATVRALTLFQDSLARLDDPHRDPRTAIAAATEAPTGTKP